MPEERKYKVGDETFTIPEKKVKDFLIDFPNALEVNSFKVGNDVFNIPISEVDSFLKDVPTAEVLKKKELGNLQSPSTVPLVSAVGEFGLDGGESVPSGINYLEGTNFTEPSAPQSTGLNIQQNPADQLRAAGTLETTPVDQNNFNPETQKTGFLLGDKTESFMRGASRLGGSIMKTPGFLYDAATAVTNNVINRPLGINDAPTAAQIGDNISDEANPISAIDKAVQNSQDNFYKKYDKSISEYFSKGELDKGFSLLANSIAETAPTTIALMLGNAAGLSTAGSVFGGGAVFGAEKMSELEKTNPNITQDQKVMVSAANGLLEGAFEQFGLTKLGSITKDVLKKSGAEEAKRIATEGFKISYAKILKQYLGTSAEEALSEAATQFAQNAIDKYSGVNPDLDLKEGVVDAAIIGLGAGASMSAPTSALSIVKTKKAITQASKLADQKQALENDLQSPDVSEAVKPAISRKIKEINEQEADLAQEEKEKFQALPEESKRQVDELLKESNRISDAVTDQTISDDTKEILKKDLDEVDKKIDKIFEEAKAENSTEDVKEEPVNTDIQDEIDYLTEIQNAIGLNEEESTRLAELQPKNVDPKTILSPEAITEPIELNPTIEPQIQNTDAIQNDVTRQEIVQNNQTGENIQSAQDASSGSVEPGVFEVNQENAETVPPEPNDEQKGTQVENVESEPKLEAVNSKELIDEEEQLETKKQDDPISVQRLNDDIEIMKQLSTKDGKVDKKFQAILERAFKMKKDGKISRPIYIQFKNKAKDVYEGKLKTINGLDSTDAKLASTKAIERVKKSLNDQGYKNIYNKFSYKYDGVENETSFDERLKMFNALKGKSNYYVLNFIKEKNIDNGLNIIIDSMIKNVSRIDNFVFFKGITGNIFSQYSGYFHPVSGAVALSMSGVKRASVQEIIHVLTHEYVHAFTANALVKPEVTTKTDEETEFTNKIELIYNQLKNISTNKDDYGFTNKLEFVAEIMSNPVFVTNLKKNQEGKSLWNKIINAIKKLLGIKSKNVKLINKAINDILEFIPKSTPEKDVFNGYSKRIGEDDVYEETVKNKHTAYNISDLLMLANDFIHRGINADLSLKQASEKALSIIKKHPAYKQLIKSKELKEVDFENAFKDAFKEQIESTKERINKDVLEGDITGEKRKKKTVIRLESSVDFKDIVDGMDEDEKFYQSVDGAKAVKHIDTMLDEFEEQELLEGLAKDIIAGNNPFNEKIENLAAFKLADRLRIIAQKEGNDLQKSVLNKLAGQLMAAKNRKTNVAATQTALESEVAKLLPLSEEGLKEYVNATMSGIQDTYLNKDQKKDIETAIKDINDIIETEEGQKVIRDAVQAEIDRIAEATRGKEWVSKFDSIMDSLKIDLTEC